MSAPAAAGSTGRRNIVLAGPMGVGKSAVGRVLARRLRRRFADTDALVAEAAGMPVADVFAQRGEAAFRALEAEAVAGVCARTDLVVAVGGGAVLDPASAARLRAAAHVVLLDADPAALTERVAPGLHSGQRPLLHGAEDATAVLRRLQAERAEAYAQVADVRFDTTGRTVDEVADDVVAWLRAQGGQEATA